MADVLMVHAHDHLADAVLMKELAKSLISMEKEIQELKAELQNR